VREKQSTKLLEKSSNPGEYMQHSNGNRISWLDRPLSGLITVNWETVLFIAILIAAVFTRFHMLEPRVMSHDETSHVYFSWLLYQGRGYQHDPVTHGPFQFHILALSYFLFGDNDLTARIPAALFSIATVGFMWFYRRYLGKAGALIAAALLVISPFMLYYGRYVRNEAFVALYGVIILWAMLRYMETGIPRYLLYLTAATSLHYATKETSYIYSAQALLFVAFFFLYRVTARSWPYPKERVAFVRSLLVGFILIIIAAGFVFYGGTDASLAQEGLPENGALPTATTGGLDIIVIVLGALAAFALLLAAYYLVKGYTWEQIRSERSFDLLILQGTLVLPLLTAFPLKMMGWGVPTNVTSIANMTTIDMIQMGSVLLVMSLIAVAVGLWWNRKIWLANAALFYAIFTVLFTTIFTNGPGFFTGLLGGLGYWLEQQPVQRGSQPGYYYALIQVPIYEYLPALGSLLALVMAFFGIRPARSTSAPADTEQEQATAIATANSTADATADAKADATATAGAIVTAENEVERFLNPPVLPLLGFWALTSLSAYTIAGEKMPWLTVHIAFPLILTAAWGFDRLVESINWGVLRTKRAFLALVLLPVFLLSFSAAFGSLMGTNRPFQGQELAQLQATSGFLMSLLVAIVSGWGLARALQDWEPGQFGRVTVLAIFGFLAILTARTAFTASYINFDQANELLVYAHSGPGNKIALAQIEELSRRTTDGLGMMVAYDDQSTYPFWWYLRNYTNQRYFGDNPTRDLRDAPVILVGQENYSKIAPVVGQAYYSFEYVRIWWPDQDYYDLTWARIWNAITNPDMRTAIFQIWLNRDYTLYASLVNKDLSLPNWEPARRMRLYLRKDIASQLWNYGTGPAPGEVVADPYEGNQITVPAEVIFGATGSEPGQFMGPRGLATAPDGSLYVADTGNHRIQHFAPDGSLIQTWGGFNASDTTSVAPPGAFNEPWDLAIGPDSSVYVADTWNHRIQKFSPDGEFITTWGFGISQSGDPFGFYGPRGIAVNAEGQVFVTDTGNKRVVVYDSDGGYITQFGSAGFAPGQFDEPVGITIDEAGQIYIADTWNQRVQVMAPDGAGNYLPARSWDIVGWFGTSLNNYPYIAVHGGGVFVTDPEGYRVLEFTDQGEFVQFWGDYGTTAEDFALPVGIDVGLNGRVWVVDSANSRVMGFNLPER
jgi:predicted membrane-bound mannosyltransferase/sugar lactone lactonase YvrE